MDMDVTKDSTQRGMILSLSVHPTYGRMNEHHPRGLKRAGKGKQTKDKGDPWSNQLMEKS